MTTVSGDNGTAEIYRQCQLLIESASREAHLLEAAEKIARVMAVGLGLLAEGSPDPGPSTDVLEHLGYAVRHAGLIERPTLATLETEPEHWSHRSSSAVLALADLGETGKGIVTLALMLVGSERAVSALGWGYVQARLEAHRNRRNGVLTERGTDASTAVPRSV